MIKVDVTSKINKFDSIEIIGHGGLEKGQDIYCAGVSTCLIGAINNIDEPEKFNIKIEDGHCMIIKKESITYHDEIVLETLIRQLQTISDSYPDYVRIKFSRKEV